MNIMNAKTAREMANNVKKDAFVSYIESINRDITAKAQLGKYIYSFSVSRPLSFEDVDIDVFLHDIIKIFVDEGYGVSSDNSSKVPLVTLRW